jgi:type IV pilus assembly protein PilQ
MTFLLVEGIVLNSIISPKKYIIILTILVLVSPFFGCGATKDVKKDAFFEKWNLKAEEARGKSPAAKIRTIEIPDDDYLKEGVESQKKPLPTKKISLKMRDADIKVVLHTLARAAKKNILVKSTVTGQVNVNFRNVPWDEAFLSILRSEKLTYVWEGNIIRIVTMEDLNNDAMLVSARNKLNPLHTIVIPINYITDSATDDQVKEGLKDLRENVESFLTKDVEGKSYGSVKIDKHTNSLILQASRSDLEKIIPIVKKIDKPIPQVRIEANIVEATSDTARDLGIQWGGMYSNVAGNQNYYITPGGTAGSGASASGASPLEGGYTPSAGQTGISGQGFGVNFPVGVDDVYKEGMGSLGLMFGTLGGNILEMQLYALQQEGKLNILSRPSITTLDNQMAFTENGEKVPYVTIDQEGDREVKFEDVVLRLEITPHVIDGDNLKMKINIKKDEVDLTRTIDGNPFIIKKEADTSLIVKNGETIVISGLSKQRTSEKNNGIPCLKDIPYLGYLFRGEGKGESMEEVLIFITPHILKADVVKNTAG